MAKSKFYRKKKKKNEKAVNVKDIKLHDINS